MKPLFTLTVFSVPGSRFSAGFSALRFFVCITLCLLILCVSGCSPQNTLSSKVQDAAIINDAGKKDVENDVSFKNCDPVADFIGGMTLEEKIAQLFIVSIDGTDARTSAIVYDIPPCGYILFARNFTGSAEQIIRLTGDVQSFYAGFYTGLRSASSAANVYCSRNSSGSSPQRIPPLFAIDHEGGEVNRLRGIASPLPSAQSVARFLNPEQAETLYRYAAEQIAALGIQLNFAPVAETAGAHNKDFLGLRSFGSLEQTQTYASAFIRAFTQSEVFCVLKHFPGNTNDDPHKVLPVLTESISDMEKLYFAPFSFLLTSLPSVTNKETLYSTLQSLSPFPCAGVLMSHVRVKAFDEDMPACFSPVLIENILKKQLGFDGLIFSDDLYMGALNSSDFSVSQAAETALRAGVHVFMLSRSVYRDFIPEFALKASSDPGLTMLIDEAVSKILKAKLYMGLMQLTAPVCENGGSAVNPPSFIIQPAPLDKLYNPEQQMWLFSEAKKKGESLYYEHWAK